MDEQVSLDGGTFLRCVLKDLAEEFVVRRLVVVKVVGMFIFVVQLVVLLALVEMDSVAFHVMA